MDRASRWLTAASIAVLLSAASTASAQTDEARAAARAAATEGVAAIEAGRYGDAVDLFTRAESLVHAPPHLLYMARANAKLGRLVRAQEAYVKVTREELPPNAPRAFVDARDAAVAELEALKPRIPSVKIVVEGGGPDAVVTMDGTEVPRALYGIAHPVDPGEHAFVLGAAGTTGASTTRALAEGANETISLTWSGPLPATAPPSASSTAPEAAKGSSRSGLRTASYAVLGLGVVGVAAGTIFMLKNRSARGDADALCPDGHCLASQRSTIESLDSSADSAATLSWIGYGVGVAGLAAGAVMFIASSGTHDSSKMRGGVRVRPVAGLGSIGLTGSF